MKILLFSKQDSMKTKYKNILSELNYFINNIEDELDIEMLKNIDNYDMAIIYIDDILDFLDLVEKLRIRAKKMYILAIYKDINVDLKIDGYYLGVDDYYPAKKSVFELSYKLKAIERIINRYSQANNENILECRDLKLNIENREVLRNNKLIDLTNKEYKILEFFLKNKNRILTRSMIAEKIWDVSFTFNSNLVDVYITGIRKKINKDNPVKLIETVRGAGYILRE
ncbi:response regulator transcription factor [Oceanivirga miroungae]|uniref:OmpR/PhoB-type domain-containing protein n=1 Tax=Oceanivirga miroungae TaxID=1130046 RepID=A0A6I8MBN4_9FUSO|nr:response regulator transcription factor [Oceanivirga miroungae]VWL85647.1 hypothetical protein OMES3154_00932 [Oceanivirga miroungae]